MIFQRLTIQRNSQGTRPTGEYDFFRTSNTGSGYGLLRAC